MTPRPLLQKGVAGEDPRISAPAAAARRRPVVIGGSPASMNPIASHPVPRSAVTAKKDDAGRAAEVTNGRRVNFPPPSDEVFGAAEDRREEEFPPDILKFLPDHQLAQCPSYIHSRLS